VIESDEARIRENTGVSAVSILRGSTTQIPARDQSFDVAVAFHYLHEVDPFFHANVVSELARVARRVAVVEPAPPSDALGKRIATLYSRAKRELGQFEYYQNIDYWRKLLSIVKADVTQQTLSFARTPPRFAINDTVAFILDTMEAEDTPKTYLDELRALAKRPDAQLVPQARYVLIGAAPGEIPAPYAGTAFREGVPLLAPSPLGIPAAATPPAAPAVAAPAAAAKTYSAPAAPEMPPVLAADDAFAPPAAAGPRPFIPPAAEATVAAAAPPKPPAPPKKRAAPKAPAPPAPAMGEMAAPFGMPFALPDEHAEPDVPFGMPAANAPAGMGWEWEPPELPLP
jgi:hypothetical protein